MARTVEISLPADKADRLVDDLRRADGIVGMSLHRGASLKPPGDVLAVHATNEGLQSVLELIARLEIGDDGSVLTSEPSSLVSPSSQDQIEQETNEASWPEMAALLRRETNITVNYLLAMLLAGAVAAVGLWTDTVHIVVGAMVIAPGFQPIIRVPFGVLANEARGWRQGLASTGTGYAAMMLGAAASFLVLRLVEPSSNSLGEHHWVQYWSSVKPTSVLVSVAASAAGAAIIAAQRSVLTAGVMIALALVPSASIAGMALVAGDLPLAGKGLMRWATDAACVTLAGGLVFLFKRDPLGRKRIARASGPL